MNDMSHPFASADRPIFPLKRPSSSPSFILPPSASSRKMKRSHITMDAAPTGKLHQQTLPDGTPLLRLPQKRFYRQRAHANVFNDHQLH